MLKRLADAASDLLFVTRLPVIHELASFAVYQRSAPYGVSALLPMWCLNVSELMGVMRGTGFSLEREFLLNETRTTRGAPEECSFRGFLFRREKG